MHLDLCRILYSSIACITVSDHAFLGWSEKQSDKCSAITCLISVIYSLFSALTLNDIKNTGPMQFPIQPASQLYSLPSSFVLVCCNICFVLLFYISCWYFLFSFGALFTTSCCLVDAFRWRESSCDLRVVVSVCVAWKWCIVKGSRSYIMKWLTSSSAQ